MAESFGIDVGGSGIKGATVESSTGAITDRREEFPTPRPATPEAVADVVADLVGRHAWTGPIGVTFPAIIKKGVALSAANVDKSWIGADAEAAFRARVPGPVLVVNDADAAGHAEMRLGAGRGERGVVLVVTFGTGIGTALFTDGHLVPNTELGHLELDGQDAEAAAAASVKDRLGLSWEDWTERVAHYLSYVERLLCPDLFVVGGGVSKVSDKWVPHLGLRTPVRPAQLHNDAGIVGAALLATERRSI